MGLGQLVGFAYASLFGFVMPLTFFIIAMLAGRRREEMHSRERVAAAERGIPPMLLQRPRRRRPMSPRAGALVLMALGIGLSFAMWQGGEREWGYGAIPGLIGAALLIHWMTGGGDSWRRQQELNDDLQRAYIDAVQRSAVGDRPGPTAAAPQP
jgi:hypothetical protein